MKTTATDGEIAKVTGRCSLYTKGGYYTALFMSSEHEVYGPSVTSASVLSGLQCSILF